MKKFAVMLTNANTEMVLAFCETKEEGIETGQKLRKVISTECGLINLISSEFDENGNMTSNVYKFYGGW